MLSFFFLGRGKLKEAQEALGWLRGWVEPHKVQTEFKSLVKSIRPDLQKNEPVTVVSVIGKTESDKGNKMEDEISFKTNNNCVPNVDNYKKRTFLIPFFLVCLAFLTGHFSGLTTTTTYAVNIFGTLGAPIDKYLATLILGVAQILGTLFCVIMIHYTGKRPLVFLSTAGAAVVFSCVGFYAHFFLGVVKLDNGAYIKEHPDLDGYSWVPMCSLIGGSFFAFTALRLLPWILIGEVYPPEVRGFASGASASVGYILGFTSNKTFFSLINLLTFPGVYWLYSACGLIATVIFYFLLPETEGWTLHEIEDHFAGKINLLYAGKKKTSKHPPEGIDNPYIVGDEISKL